MVVTVSRRASLARRKPSDDEDVELADGATAQDLLAACAIDGRACVVVVNGAAVTRAAALHDGDRVQVYPAQAGG